MFLLRPLNRLGIFLLCLCSFNLAAESEVAQDQAQQTFRQCITQLQVQAIEAGVPKQLADEVLGNAKFLEKIISYDRNQPEFVQTFSGYFGKRISDWRVSQGRELLEKHAEFLATITQQYGVPASYLVAFWGLETNFGSFKGKMPIIDSLTTLSCDQRRSQYFSGELIQALLLMDRENIAVTDMLGSWAGAMGHTQFMPSAYMLYAKDGDGDGKIDLWNSERDALVSAANFLIHLGWKSGYRWGREISLPNSFDYQLTGKERKQSLTFWGEQGITRADGSALGRAELLASVLIPAGHEGPSFLIYDNFDVILRWNNSEYYGIAVGHLADRIAGQAKLSKSLPELDAYTLAEMQQLQIKLNELGFDVGAADGILGPATRKGVRGFQIAKDMIADGYPARNVYAAIMSVVTTP